MYGLEFSDKQHMRDLMLDITKNKLFGKDDSISFGIMDSIAKDESILDRRYSRVSNSMSGGWGAVPKYVVCYKNRVMFSDNCHIDVSIWSPHAPRVDLSIDALKLNIQYSKQFAYMYSGFDLMLRSEYVKLDVTNDTVAKALDVAFVQLMNDSQAYAYDSVQSFRGRVLDMRSMFDAAIS